MKYSSLRLFKGSKAVKAGTSAGDDEDAAMKRALEKQRRPVDDAFELADSFRRRFDGGDDEDSSGSSEEESDSESGSESDSEEESDVDDDASHDNDEEDQDGSGSSSSPDSDSDEEEKSDSDSDEKKQSWKTNIAKEAAMNYLRREKSFSNMQQLVYGTPGGSGDATGAAGSSNMVSEEDNVNGGSDDDDSDSDEEFFKLRDNSKKSSASPNNTSGGTGGSGNVLEDIQLGENDSSRMLPNASQSAGGMSFNVNAWLEEGDDCLIESIVGKRLEEYV